MKEIEGLLYVFCVDICEEGMTLIANSVNIFRPTRMLVFRVSFRFWG